MWCKIKGGAVLILNSHYQKQIEDSEQMWHESNSQAVCATHVHARTHTPLLSERLLETHLFHIDSAGTVSQITPTYFPEGLRHFNPLCINEQLRSIHSSFPCSSLSFAPHLFHHSSPFVTFLDVPVLICSSPSLISYSEPKHITSPNGSRSTVCIWHL